MKKIAINIICIVFLPFVILPALLMMWWLKGYYKNIKI